jgi:hypothetical protein
MVLEDFNGGRIAAVNGAQVTLDPKDVREWLPHYTYGAHAVGLKSLDEVEKQREKLADWSE